MSGGSGSGGGGSAPAAPTEQATQPAFGPNGSGGSVNGGAGAFNGTPNQYTVSGGINPAYSQIFGSTNTVIPYTQQYTDPLGPNASGAMAPTGGPEMRAGIYNTIQSLFPELNQNTQNSETALNTAASNPGYTNAATLANNEISGNYLNGSPELDNAVSSMRQGSAATAANTDAQIKSGFAQNGMSFGTGNQEAQDANDAAANASANQNESAMRLSNYQTERQNQNAAVSTLDDATGSPVNYLSQTNAAQLSPLSSIAQMISGLSGGGSTSYQPQDVVNTQGYARQLTSTIGQL